MKSWTTLGFSVGLVGAIAACTVTTSPLDDGGLGSDAGSSSDATSNSDSTSNTDTGTGGDSGACTLEPGLLINDATCTACLQTSCCESVNACFTSTTGSNSDCHELQNCINNAIANDPLDAGGDAGGKLADDIQICRDAHPMSVTLEAAWTACLSAHCTTECGL